ncbi:MAG: M81 family metallopeptidase [Alphaproteobacteria bacterium]|nr:M81 family metallopeptidase [Alphaproteobacteria bacterium]
MKRFVVAVFKHETNTFSPLPTPLEAFDRYNPRPGGPVYGEEAVATYRGTNTPVAAYIDLIEEEASEPVFAIAASATPGGPVADSAFEHCAAVICDTVTAGCDGLFLDLHGGMVTETHDDPEGELLRRIRAIAPGLPIAVAFDFHTNLSQTTVDNATVITGYRTYPHVDTYETGMRAGRTLMRAMRGEVEPVIIWHSLPILSHLNRQTPSRQPMKDIMDLAIAAESGAEVLNASVFGCFPLADIPHVGMHGVIVAEGAAEASARRLLHELMSMAWERRRDFVFETEPVATSIARAKGLGDGPIVLADHSDVAGSGGSTDVTDVLREIIAQGLENVCAGPIWDPDSVARMAEAGSGAEITLSLGGKTDFPAIGLKGEPLEVRGTVKRITDGTFTVTAPMKTGTRICMGRSAVLDTGPMEILVTSERHEPFDTGCFTHAGVDPAQKNYIVLKSRQHFRAGFEPILKDVVMVSGRGICSSDYSLFPWRNLRRPIFPLDPETTVDLPPMP